MFVGLLLHLATQPLNLLVALSLLLVEFGFDFRLEGFRRGLRVRKTNNSYSDSDELRKKKRKKDKDKNKN
jgi:hypothetical protein